ncbi:MAG: lytic transglycosylase domain-containing protein [Deltaproteobacteria bacterium]|nr:lytic transglycosylase domain-containing protein [Deltaproteobacteria bacterium]
MPSTVRIPLSQYAGGLIQVTAVPPTDLSLTIRSHRLEGHALVVSASGPVENLPDQTACTVTWMVTRKGEPARAVVGGSVPLCVSGTTGSVELRLNVIEAGMFGRGQLSLQLDPDFPAAGQTTVGGVVDFDWPCGVELAGYANTMKVGHVVDLRPHRHAVFSGCTLQVRVTEFDPEGDDADTNDEGGALEQVWEWGPGESEVGQWRVGCTDADGEPISNLCDPGEKGAAELRVEVRVRPPGGVNAAVEVSECTVPRPRLTRLRLLARNDALIRFSWNDPGAALRWLRDQPEDKDMRWFLEGEISGLEPGFRFPLEASLWGHKPLTGRQDVRVMTPLTAPTPSTTNAHGRFEIAMLDLAALREMEQLRPYIGYEYFGVLRLPPGSTGTEDYVPVGQALDYDGASFSPFLDEDFATPVSGQGRRNATAVELGTGVCTNDIGPIRPIRLPHFGTLTFSVRGTMLVASCDVHGPLEYWSEAAPTIMLILEDGSEAPLKTAARPEDPRVVEASIAMTDRRIKGKCIGARIEVGNPEATLDGTHAVGAPGPQEAHIDCRPQLGPVTWKVEVHGEQRVGRLLCGTRFFPTHPGAKKGLRMAVCGYYQGIEGAVPLGVTPRYTIPDSAGGADGRVGASGLLEAHITDAEQVERIEAGRFRVEVWRHFEDGKVYGLEVPRTVTELGEGVRAVPAGKVIFASKVSTQFKANLKLVASQMGIDPNYLMAVMAFETGQKFLPTWYSSSKAVGLIQFKTNAAQTIGTTLGALQKLTAEQQLFEVHKYYEFWMKTLGRVTTLEDIYMVTFCPAGVGKPLDHVLYSAAKDAQDGTKYYWRNSGLDVDGSKTITKYEAAAKVREAYHAGLADLG